MNRNKIITWSIIAGMSFSMLIIGTILVTTGGAKPSGSYADLENLEDRVFNLKLKPLDRDHGAGEGYNP